MKFVGSFFVLQTKRKGDNLWGKNNNLEIKKRERDKRELLL